MDLEVFYDEIRKTITLTDQNVRGFDFLISEASNREVPVAKAAYVLATTFHETASTMQPVREYGGETYLKSKRYYPYVGMGYVQLTWQENYEKAGRELGIDFVKNPKLLLEPQYAAPILFIGMEEGWFTGKKLDDYIDGFLESDKEDLREFSNARRVVNGTDRQVLIGQYALVFDRALRKAGYEGSGTIYYPGSQTPVDSLPELKNSDPGSLWSIIKAIFRAFGVNL